MNNKNTIARYIESLALIMQESAEIGQMDHAVYADILELIAELAGKLNGMEAAEA